MKRCAFRIALNLVRTMRDIQNCVRLRLSEMPLSSIYAGQTEPTVEKIVKCEFILMLENVRISRPIHRCNIDIPTVLHLHAWPRATDEFTLPAG
jgi:hypothetical protein